ncbi:hypothetical protein NUK34_06135 [Kerstersia gyiorum]|uniref:hypothetical protein n=1 Tax=Kerstersia gyiorum TaxID=206506 RepID=UPI00214FC878|nr:hypothetical protein [Kerstersia gyiorum]MCR4158432.1 hypothetical protein [Kerstersia gyiorum]
MALARLIFFGLFFAVAPAMAANWSGLYLGVSKDNGYIALQLIETKAGGVIGRYREVVVTEIGAKSDSDVSVSGNVHGDQIIGRIERAWIQGGAIAFSGTRTNSGIRLSGGDGLRGNLFFSTEQDEQKVITELMKLAKQAGDVKRTEKAQREADRHARSELADLDSALSQAKEFQSKGAETVAALGKVPAHYETITVRQEQMAAYARTLSDGVARSQVSIAINSLTISELIGTNIRVESSVGSAEAARDRVLHNLSTAKTICIERGSKGLYEEEYLARCQLIPAAAEAADKLSKTMEALFNRLDAAFKTAEERSDTLTAAVDALR